MNHAPVMWTPDPHDVEQSNMTRFQAAVGLPDATYEQLHRWSIAQPGEFWSAVWDFAGITGDPGTAPFVRSAEAPMTGSRFFPDASLNIAENLLQGDPSERVVTQVDECGTVTRTLTRGELLGEVGQVQRALTSLGVGAGDRVAGVLPNTADALVYTLATLSLGAVWTSCAPEFGAAGILDRFGQVDPSVLVVVDHYVYNGKTHALVGKGLAVAEQLPSLQHLVVVGDVELPDRAGSSQVHLASGLYDDENKDPVFARLPFDHPCYIVYTSGTTGMPKSIVHRAGGVLLNLVKEHLLHGDVRPGDRMLYYTNTAWMMYHWSIAALACRASVVLYDGAAIPDRDPEVLWRLLGQHEVTHFGTSPKYLSVMEKRAAEPARAHTLDHLRVIFSAGAPLTEANFAWVYGHVKADLCLASISGGTEILGCFVLGNPTRPVRSGEIQGPGLGMSVAAVDNRQVPVVGRKGDLVCTEPFPSMPLGFWGERGWERYLEAYFSEKDEVWYHGDLAEFRPSGGVVISGRTDTTLKPGGVRIGTSEIYRVVEAMDTVADSVVIGYPTDDDMEVWLFVVPATGTAPDATEIRQRLREQATPRHVPTRIFRVPEVPYTLAGKKVEGAVLNVVLGREVPNKASLANPKILADYTPEQLAGRQVYP